MGTTPNYEFNVPVGSDIVNLLTQNNPNWSNLDTILKTISNTGVGTATELKTGTVHSLTRSDTDRKVFTFVATTNFVAGETFLLDGEQVTALTASGEQLSTGCYVIGSNVLVSVHDTLLTFYVPESTAKDAQRLGGELPSHYATEADLEEIQTDMSAVEAKLGTGVFQTQAQNAVDAVNELNTHLKLKSTSDYMTAYNGASEYIIVVGQGTLPSTSKVALSIYIPKSAITSTPYYWQVTDAYNGANFIHLQALLDNTSCGAGMYYGAGLISDSTITYYYR